MPQATDELRAEWRHGDEDGGERLAIRFLTEAGYMLRDDWQWRPPARPPTQRELSAIDYLIDEWDYGPVAPPYPGEWQAATMERLMALGYAGFIFGPGVNWWPMNAEHEKMAGPFTSTQRFDAWLASQEATRAREAR